MFDDDKTYYFVSRGSIWFVGFLCWFIGFTTGAAAAVAWILG